MSTFQRKFKKANWALAAALLMLSLSGCFLFKPIVDSVSPDEVPATLGETITLTGSNFKDTSVIMLMRADATLHSVINTTFTSGSEISFDAPTLPSLTAPEVLTFVVSNPNGHESDPVELTYLPPPSVMGVNPNAVPATIATALTLTGEHFDSPAQVRFRRQNNTIIGTVGATVVNDTTITITSVPDATVTQDTIVFVDVINPDGQEAQPVVKAIGEVTYLAPTTISGASPDEVPANAGATVVLSGQNLRTGSTVTLAGLPGGNQTIAATSANGAGTQLTFDAPTANVTADTAVTLTVTSPAGNGQTAQTTITYLALPTLTAVTPSEVPATIATSVSLTGTNLVEGSTIVLDMPTDGPTTIAGAIFNGLGTGATFTSPIDLGVLADVDVTITVTRPEDAGLTVDSSVTYLAPPTITDIDPASVLSVESETLTISGTNFDAGTTVTFGLPISGDTLGTNINVNGAGTTLMVDTPTEPTQSGDETVIVTVTASDGQSVSSTVDYVAVPTILSVTPIELPTQFGLPFSVNGTGFQTGATVTIDGIACTNVNVVNNTLIQCTSPARPGLAVPTTVPVVVSNPNAQVSDEPITVTYFPPPVVNSLDITFIPATIPTTLTVTGTFFRGDPLPNAVGATTVIFREAVAPFNIIDSVDAQIVNDTTLSVLSPVLNGLLADLDVTLEVVGPQGQGQSTALLNATYSAPPNLFSATCVPPLVPSTIATVFAISGASNLTLPPQGIDVLFTRADTNEEFGVVTITNNTDTDASGLTPILLGLTENVPVQVRVRNNDDQQVSESFLSKTYVAPPIISSVLHGTLDGPEVPATIASPVAINGSNFQAGATSSYQLPVLGATAGAAVFASAILLNDTSPALPSATITLDALVEVTITNPDGQVSAPVAINYQAEPGITAIQTGKQVQGIVGDVLPATIALDITATVSNCLIDPINAASLGSGEPDVEISIPVPPMSVSMINVTCQSETSLSMQSPGAFTNTDDQLGTATITDAYGQVGITTANIVVTAPPTLTEFQATFNQEFGPFTDRDIFPSTIASAYTLIGTNLRGGAEVEFFRTSAQTDSLGVDTATISVPNTEVTGTTPTITDPELASHLLDVTIIVMNTDMQVNVIPYSGIKAVARPDITGATDSVSGGTAFIVANGPFRNEFTGTFGNATTVRIVGANLNSQSPNPLDPLSPGAAFVGLDGGSLAIDGSRGPGAYGAGGGDDQGRILNNTTVEMEFRDSMPNLIAERFGSFGILELTDYTGQKTETGIEDVILTIRGPFAGPTDEGHAVAMGTGDINGDGQSDLAVLTSGVATGARLEVFFGTTENTLPILADVISPIALGASSGLTTLGSQNMLVQDIDGDGFDDVFVGIPDADFATNPPTVGGGTPGAVHIWNGSGSGVSGTGPDFTIDASEFLAQPDAAFGAALALGDFNGDQLLDLAVGAPGVTINGQGAVYLYLGNAEGINSSIADLVLEVEDSNTGGRVDGFGMGIAFGDVDGDGDDDLFAGAPGFDGLSGVDQGRVWIWFGDINLDDTPDQTITGVTAGGAAGYPLVLDANGDALEDVLIGRPNFDGNGGGVRLYLGQVDPGTGAFTVTPASGGDPSGDAGLQITGTIFDNTGVTSSIKVVDDWGILMGGSNVSRNGVVPGFVDRYSLDALSKAFTLEFNFVETYDKPQGVGFADGEQYGAYVEGANVRDTDESGVDVFVNVPGAIGGANNGFLVMFPAAKDVPLP